jgi:probable FeS assembly SUF system protein SufT
VSREIIRGLRSVSTALIFPTPATKAAAGRYGPYHARPGVARAFLTCVRIGMSGFSLSSEPFTLARDCEAVMVPQGETVTLPAGQSGYITQALGGSFSVYVEGNLFRVAGKDADALGKLPPPPIELPEDATDADVERLVWEQLYTVFDPEIPVNVVELGLVYDVSLSHIDDSESSRKVYVKMTLTAPGCGMGDILVDDARTKLELIPTIEQADVDLVFDPPWNRDMMSDIAKLETGML